MTKGHEESNGWEYRTVMFRLGDEEALDRLGRAGWELISVVDAADSWLLFLKRPRRSS